MDKDLSKKTLYIMLAVSALIFAIIIFMFVNYIKNNKDGLAIEDPNYQTPRVNISAEEKKEVNRLYVEKYAKVHKGRKDVPDLSKVNYKEYADYQFAKPTSEDDIVKIKYAGVDGEITIKLFTELAPDTVRDYKNAIKSNVLEGVKVTSVTTSDLLFPSIKKDGTGIFKSANESDLNFALVPYKGSLVKTLSTSPEDAARSEHKIIVSGMEEFNQKVINNLGISRSLEQELNEKGGRLYGHYLTQVVFGQVVEGMDVLEKATKVLSDKFKDQSLPASEKSLTVERIELFEATK